MNNAIIEFLNLRETYIESIQCSSLKDELIVNLSLLQKNQVCPRCHLVTNKVLNFYTRKVNHGIFINRKCIVYFKQKRYKCHSCLHTFNEPSTLVSKSQKKSRASHMQIMELLKDPHTTFTYVARLLSLSDNTVIDTFYDNVPDYKPSMPEMLCIDEVYLGRNSTKKYAAVLLDFKKNAMTDIIYGRNKDDFHHYLQKFSKEELNKVKYLSTDMFEGYRSLQKMYFKHALLCVDSFHVIQLINTMFHKELLRIMRNYEKDSIEYYLLKHKKYFLLKNSDSVKDWYKQEYNHKLGYFLYLTRYRELLFNIDPLIKDLYELKVDYIAFNRLKDKELIIQRFDILLNRFINHENREIVRVGRTLLKWKQEILNSFNWYKGRRISNGPIESRNNTIKLVIRNAAGYRKFNHLRTRIIYCVNTNK
ncbi:MAG: ISL3 family transposase [Erysipelothrix sp.]